MAEIDPATGARGPVPRQIQGEVGDRLLQSRGFTTKVLYFAGGRCARRVARQPALAGLDIPRTGEPCAGLVGPLVTRTLVIMGECSYHALPDGQRGAMLRAYDKATGADVGAVYMPAPQSGSPMTYMLDGRQYIVLAISGGAYSGEYVAFALPS